jgi:hemolysin III
MGWIVIVAIYPIYKNLSASGLLWLVAGGIFYTVGAVIYAIKKPNPIPGVFGFHEIWHIFVILGTTAHFVSVYFYT